MRCLGEHFCKLLIMLSIVEEKYIQFEPKAGGGNLLRMFSTSTLYNKPYLIEAIKKPGATWAAQLVEFTIPKPNMLSIHSILQKIFIKGLSFENHPQWFFFLMFRMTRSCGYFIPYFYGKGFNSHYVKGKKCLLKIKPVSTNHYASKLQLCHSRSSVSFSLARTVHAHMISSGFKARGHILNRLIDIYCKSSKLILARKLFDEIPHQDVVARTTLVATYCASGDLKTAREIACKCILDGFTYTGVISACANAGLFQIGKQVHAYLLRTEANPTLDYSLSVNNALITFYSKCGKIDEARDIFNQMQVRDLVSWNAILSAYVSGGRIEEAQSHFRNMRDRNLLTWNVMISGLAQNGFGEEGLKLFNKMKLEGLEPCDYAFAGAITSCSVLGSLDNGRQLHAQLVRFGFEASLSAGNALITMYARCGVVEAADCLFNTMPSVDSVSWNAMIAALGQHGRGAQAVELYERMLKEGILPDRITFLTILSACSHAGLVEDGRRYFDSMHKLYGIAPGEDHYARVIDLLCRAGRFSEALDVIESMPFKPGAPIWEALLAGCRIHGNMDLGIQAAERLFEMIPQHDGTYVLLSNMYAALGKWDDAAKIRKLMRDRGIKKEPGCSWIEVENKVHVFFVDDTMHPEVQAVYNYLQEMVLKMRKLGYVPDTKFVLHDLESHQKEYALTTHSEKLAVVFGLMKLPRGATIRVFKNLRICGDCHNAFKFMSKVAGREIVVRDGKRFHHFRNGECSCSDYW
ncbi:hypothetical protein JRO89_XS07G0028200 [Xanthoceras sorbifolium]|uniref:DYW domain-containing protein n=1 Tax=Xanthoceras sorbifolium TaxID=99658 RepID=A0ABQ8HSA5_9ROSI|nr:hypothetical protein JRO89_XS07G0028200 [Xanthoceras sorbifolium]